MKCFCIFIKFTFSLRFTLVICTRSVDPALIVLYFSIFILSNHRKKLAMAKIWNFENLQLFTIISESQGKSRWHCWQNEWENSFIWRHYRIKIEWISCGCTYKQWKSWHGKWNFFYSLFTTNYSRIMLDRTKLYQTSDSFELNRSSTKTKFWTISDPSKKPEMGRTKAQISKKQTLNLSEPMFVYSNRTMIPPKPSKNPELRNPWTGLRVPPNTRAKRAKLIFFFFSFQAFTSEMLYSGVHHLTLGLEINMMC